MSSENSSITTIWLRTSWFHNIVTLSKALDRLEADGLEASDQALAALTPYQTEHINRFGSYTVNFSRIPEPLPPTLGKSESNGIHEQPAFDQPN